MRMDTNDVKWLLIDSCGAVATLAVGRGEDVLGTEELPGRTFSAGWPEAMRGLLAVAGWDLAELSVIGVVHGPGSFTGVRVGLAAAKGLCEASGVPMVAMSRLQVLAGLGVAGAVVALDAGRSEAYVRDGERERLMGREALIALLQERDVKVAEPRMAEMLTGAGRVEMIELGATSALGTLLARVRAGAFDNVAAVDAHYVREESEIYGPATTTAGA